MNGEAAFTRTIRALDADNFRRSTAGLFTAAGLLVGWAWWMLGERVAGHDFSGSVKLEAPANIALGAAGVRNP